MVQVQVQVKEQEEVSDKWKGVSKSELLGGLGGEMGLTEGTSEAVESSPMNWLCGTNRASRTSSKMSGRLQDIRGVSRRVSG